METKTNKNWPKKGLDEKTTKVINAMTKISKEGMLSDISNFGRLIKNFAVEGTVFKSKGGKETRFCGGENGGLTQNIKPQKTETNFRPHSILKLNVHTIVENKEGDKTALTAFGNYDLKLLRYGLTKADIDLIKDPCSDKTNEAEVVIDAKRVFRQTITIKDSDEPNICECELLYDTEKSKTKIVRKYANFLVDLQKQKVDIYSVRYFETETNKIQTENITKNESDAKTESHKKAGKKSENRSK